MAIMGLFQASPTPAAKDLAWMSDCWDHMRNGRHLVESWTGVEGGTLLGVSRTALLTRKASALSEANNADPRKGSGTKATEVRGKSRCHGTRRSAGLFAYQMPNTYRTEDAASDGATWAG
jgi:hypothetical protein